MLSSNKVDLSLNVHLMILEYHVCPSSAHKPTTYYFFEKKSFTFLMTLSAIILFEAHRLTKP